MIEMATDAGKYSDAWEINDEALRRFPESAKIYRIRGYLECAEEKYKEAIEDCTRANFIREILRTL